MNKEQLLNDLVTMIVSANKKGYSFGAKDIFALGFLAGKYNLDKIIDNKQAVEEACDKYDETDELKLLDTIKETLSDLEIINPIN
jgi:hypothetical protein